MKQQSIEDRQNPLPLKVQTPQCPMCHYDVQEWRDPDGGHAWKCASCDAWWERFDIPDCSGFWAKPSERQCLSEANRPPSSFRYRCAKSENHVEHDDDRGVEHHDLRGATWPNSWLVEVTHSAPKAERDARRLLTKSLRSDA